MGYYDSLDQMLKKSGLTLQEIADRCEKNFGVKINRSYISKLKTARQAPASDEINIAIANVCGWNVDEFLYEAYIEKAPAPIKDFIRNLVNVTKSICISANRLNSTDEKLALLRTQFDGLSDLEFLNKISAFKDKITEIDISEFNILDVRNIDISEENIIDQSNQIIMKDDSMEPTIPKGAVLQIDSKAKIKNGDIVFLLDKYNYEEEIRRYYFRSEIFDDEFPDTFDDEVILTSDNPAYNPLIANETDFEFIAKVISITTTTKL